jgi:hypothetical protein
MFSQDKMCDGFLDEEDILIPEMFWINKDIIAKDDFDFFQ